VSVVIDAALTLSWYFEDETTSATEAILDRVSDAGAVVHDLWRLEVANAFQAAVWRQRISPAYRDRSLAELALLPITIDADSGTYAWTTTLELAECFDLTIYEATYLELARRHSLPLATLNMTLRQAAAALDVPLLGLVGE
jgi:predicted nucleic acid-binding protein